jgi:dihydroorotate dehydrogenase
MYQLLRPLLFALDPEWVHEVVLKLSRPLGWFDFPLPGRAVQVGGLEFPNRVGLAAGFDKNARWLGVAQTLGFGHLEVGAVTPRPQAGHPRPRLFRLPESQALRNRMGFNNDGVEAIARRLRLAGRLQLRVGVNVGKNSDTPLEHAAEDYQAVMDACSAYCDYFSLNVSSPNTEGLRSLAGLEQLEELLSQLRWNRPLWVKLSPDEDPTYYQEVAKRAAGWGLAGIVATNTTLRRDPPWEKVPELGGLSGLPLRLRSPQVVAWLRQAAPDLPIIGVGGIASPAQARLMSDAGADLVQIYTGMIYAGPGLPRQLVKELSDA